LENESFDFVVGESDKEIKMGWHNCILSQAHWYWWSGEVIKTQSQSV
jgi:hypothetical protein